jgi:hypothetical protein
MSGDSRRCTEAAIMTQGIGLFALILSTACWLSAQQVPPESSAVFSSETKMALIPFSVVRDAREACETGRCKVGQALSPVTRVSTFRTCRLPWRRHSCLPRRDSSRRSACAPRRYKGLAAVHVVWRPIHGVRETAARMPGKEEPFPRRVLMRKAAAKVPHNWTVRGRAKDAHSNWAGRAPRRVSARQTRVSAPRKDGLSGKPRDRRFRLSA